jgi:hypothetical protein
MVKAHSNMTIWVHDSLVSAWLLYMYLLLD